MAAYQHEESTLCSSFRFKCLVDGSDDPVGVCMYVVSRAGFVWLLQLFESLSECDYLIVDIAQGDITSLYIGPHRSTTSSYEFIPCNVCGDLVKVRKRRKKVFVGEGTVSNETFVLCTQCDEKYSGSNWLAPRAVDKSLELFIRFATSKRESASLSALPSRCANQEAYGHALCSRARSDGDFCSALMSTLPAANDQGDPLEC